MPTFDVTSAFTAQARSKTPQSIVRQFTLGSSDYSDLVVKWPTFTRRWDEVRPKTTTLRLNNAGQALNFLRADKTKMQNDAVLSMGFTFPGSGNETIDIFSGTVRGISYANGICSISIVDKFQQLSDRKMGDSDNTIRYAQGSEYLPSDIAWWAVTSYGGLSSIESTSNPDIDFDAFQGWAAVFSSDNVTTRAEFTGQKVTEVLRKIARSTHSAIFIRNNKLSFQRFSLGDTNVASLGQDIVHSVRTRFDIDDIINRQYVSGDFKVGSVHQHTVYAEDATSVSSYGLKEHYIKDENFWYQNSDDSINLAERMILVSAQPDDKVDVTTGLAGIAFTVGETVYVEDRLADVSENYRIMEHSVNMDEGTVRIVGDRRQLASFFILDTSSLDSTTDILT